MGWSFAIGTVRGTTIRIHVTFLLLLAWIGITHWIEGGAAAAVDGVAFIALVFLCVAAVATLIMNPNFARTNISAALVNRRIVTLPERLVCRRVMRSIVNVAAVDRRQQALKTIDFFFRLAGYLDCK